MNLGTMMCLHSLGTTIRLDRIDRGIQDSVEINRQVLRSNQMQVELERQSLAATQQQVALQQQQLACEQQRTELQSQQLQAQQQGNQILQQLAVQLMTLQMQLQQAAGQQQQLAMQLQQLTVQRQHLQLDPRRKGPWGASARGRGAVCGWSSLTDLGLSACRHLACGGSGRRFAVGSRLRGMARPGGVHRRRPERCAWISPWGQATAANSSRAFARRVSAMRQALYARAFSNSSPSTAARPRRATASNA